MRPPIFALLRQISLVMVRLYHNLQRCPLVAESKVDSLGVVELQIFLEQGVEIGNIVKKQVQVVVDEFFLQSAVQSFAV